MSDRVLRFIEKSRKLLLAERQAEEEETSDVRNCLSVEVVEVEAGLGGRSQVKLQKKGDATGDGGASTSSSSSSTNSKKQLRLSVGDAIQLRQAITKDNETEGTAIRGVVEQMTDKQLVVSMDEFLEEWWESKLWISKVPNEVTYKRMEDALTRLETYESTSPHSANIVNVAFGLTRPQRSTESVEIPSFYDPNLNDSQKEAIRFALETRDVALILGPPGTGKTTTVVEFIRQAIKKNYREKVLVCAPSNIAIDNIVEKLSGKRVKMVRLGHPSRLLPSVVQHSLDSRIMYSDGNKIVNDIRQDIKNVFTKLRRTRNKGDRKVISKELKTLRKELRQREEKSIQDIIETSQVVLCTNTGANHYLKNIVFDWVVMDEAAQSLEAASWIALLKGHRAVLAGDPFQLPPTVLSMKAQDKGLARTLFERMYEMYKDEVTRMLTVQYRMHETIMNWSSNEFYEGKLVAHESVRTHLLTDMDGVEEIDETENPLFIVDTAGCGFAETEVDETESKSNFAEADIVAKHVATLVEAGIREQDIAVISPYSAQVEAIRSRIQELHPFVEIGTVDGFQGREKEAVIVSMVRSNDRGEVGFLSDERRTNVAITRARRAVAIICDSTTLANNEFLSRMTGYFEEHALVRSGGDYL